MKLPSVFWATTSDNFLEFEQFVRSIVVVNDLSERAVKLVQELLGPIVRRSARMVSCMLIITRK
jgi:hypothetical protein